MDNSQIQCITNFPNVVTLQIPILGKTNLKTKRVVSDYENVGIGSIAAFTAALTLQPTLYWKNARAMGLNFTLDPRMIYRGTETAVLNEMQMMGVQFGIASFLQRVVSSDGEINKTRDAAMACFAGAISAIPTAPLELCMIQQQRNGGLLASQLSILSRSGIKGIFRGLLPTVMRDSVYVLGMLGVTPYVQDHMMQSGMSQTKSGFYASVIGGIFAAIPSHPFDIAKTCMQGDVNKIQYNGMLHTMKSLYNNGGLSRVYSGVGWRTVNIIGTVYIANEMRIRLTSILENN